MKTLSSLEAHGLKPATDDERLCVELTLLAHELSKHYSRISGERAALITQAARRITELSQ